MIMELHAKKLATIGLHKEGSLVAIVVQNGKPTHYKVEEMGNKEVEELYEVNRADV